MMEFLADDVICWSQNSSGAAGEVLLCSCKSRKVEEKSASVVHKSHAR